MALQQKKTCTTIQSALRGRWERGNEHMECHITLVQHSLNLVRGPGVALGRLSKPKFVNKQLCRYHDRFLGANKKNKGQVRDVKEI